ncbi:MAG TPA: hypothetical protein VF815_34155 [Myxococcaceae bacterium]
MDWTAPDLVKIAEEFPGTLVSRQIEVPPGGNDVHSYLDIVCSDTARVEDIEAALDEYEQTWAASRLASVVHLREIAVRLGMQLRHEPQALQELRTLRESALKLLRSPSQPLSEWESQPPLRVLIEPEGGSNRYLLDESSLVRLQSIHGTAWREAEVSVSSAIHEQLMTRPASTCPHLASLLTCLPLDSLLPLGGIRFEQESGKLLWEWPDRGPLQGYCLSCHQQGTLRAEEESQLYRCVSCGNVQQTNGLWVATLT